MVEAYKPETLKEALELKGSRKLIPFAGGTDLMVKYQSWSGTLPKFPGDVLFLSRIDEIKGIKKEGDVLIIGAGATLTEVGEHPETPLILKEAVMSIAAPGIRNIGTLAGNLCNASPAGDSICALYTLGASIVIQNLSEKREVSVLDFIQGPGRTSLKDNELVTAIKVPIEKNSIEVFKKVGTRKANALSKLSFSAVAEVKGGVIDSIAISFGAVGPTVVRSVELEKKLEGRDLSWVKSNADSIVSDYSAMIIPIDDQRSTAKYRKQVALNLLDNFLKNELLEGE